MPFARVHTRKVLGRPTEAGCESAAFPQADHRRGYRARFVRAIAIPQKMRVVTSKSLLYGHPSLDCSEVVRGKETNFTSS
jgi:hypothetical protein